MRFRSSWCLAVAVLVLAGCGGGGGGSTTTTTKTTPTVNAWPTASAITFGQSLASSTLSGGTASVSGTFAWTTSSAQPGAGTPSESVTFTPTDSADYNTVAGSVTVTVNKATPAVTAWPTAGAITFGQSLASSTLSGGTASISGTFAWTTSSTQPGAGTPSESVTFTPTDSADYNTVAGSVSVTVSKATPAVSAWPTASAIASGQSLASSTLSGGTASVSGTFAWTSPSTVPSAGTVSESVTFTPTDSADYNTVVGSVSVTVNSATPPTVVATVPASGATGVGVSNALTATFSSAMDSSTITTSTFTLSVTNGAAVSGLVTYNSATAIATFTPNSPLAYNTSYTATVTTGAKSSAEAPLASDYVWTFTTGAAPNQVTVDFGTTYQTIRGFGGSTAWLGQMPQAVATALFSPANGLGLSILRVRTDPTGSSSSYYVTTNWSQELTNAQEAMTANTNAIVIASPWTPPASMKTSNTTYPYNTSCSTSPSSLCGGYLNTSSYADYANYLEDFVTYFKNNGVNLYAISMQNEPDAQNVGYESCYWSGATMDAWVASLTSGGATNPITTKLIMPESESFNTIYSNPTLADPSAVGNVAIVGGHLYGVQPSYQMNAEAAQKEVWMTEFGPLSSATLTWAQALTTYGESIHNSMVTGQYNAYVWWGLFGKSAGSCATAAGTCGLVDNVGNVMVMGDVMGQYSKFIQPGYMRVMATANPISGVYVSAYSNSSPTHYVIVAINSNTTTESLTFVLNNATVTSVTPYQSTSVAGLVAQTAVSVSSGQFSYTLPAQSIVTFVQ